MAHRERGDTLIEVIFATAVLALIIVISLTIMNSGTAQAQRAVEGTFVRQELDSQADLLRFARDSYINHDAGADILWNAILGQRVSTVLNFDAISSASRDCTPPGGQKAFYLETGGGKVEVKFDFTPPETYAQAGKGMWIEATPTTPGASYVDFYLYACWNSPAGTNKSTSGTIVRLYAPAE